MTALPVLRAENVSKTFTLHVQGGVQLPVLEQRSLHVFPGECVALAGASGSGKSTFMRALYGNYGIDSGSVLVRDGDDEIDVSRLDSQALAAVRLRTIGYVSQFLRVIPRVPALDVAMEWLLLGGTPREDAMRAVTGLFERFSIPERLWQLSPTTFSGGEKQRVNLARTLAIPYPVLLLDEPTSALDAESRRRVVETLLERKREGAAMVGIFHDDEVRSLLADRELVFTAAA